MSKSAIDLEDVLERVQDDWELLLELLDIFQTKWLYLMVGAGTKMEISQHNTKKKEQIIKDTDIILKGENNVYTAQAKRGLAEILLELGSLDDAKTHANNSLTILYSIYNYFFIYTR